MVPHLGITQIRTPHDLDQELGDEGSEMYMCVVRQGLS